MRPVRHLPNYTYSDYLLWEGDWELIDGIPYAKEGGTYGMSPSAGGKHQWLASLLTTEIVMGLRQNNEQCKHCISVQDVDWKVDENTVLRPDLAIVCLPLVNDYIANPPALIVEILSPSSGHRDRIIKHEIYAEKGVQYYIIIDPGAKTYQSYKLINGKYQDYNFSSFQIHKECTISVDTAKVLAELTN
jgi:Uma2 family endonuclease